MVDEFLAYLEQLFSEMGHVLSVQKMYLTLASSEFVQTYSRNGLYIPKDQIMLIPSEKPRNIRDAMEFLQSGKRVLCAKLSRGYGDFVSTVALLYEIFHLTAFTIKSSEIRFKPVEAAKYPAFFDLAAGSGLVPLTIRGMDISATTSPKKQKETMKSGKASSYEFRWSLLFQLMPICGMSIGLLPHIFNVTITDAIFFTILKRFSSTNKSMLLAMWALARRLKWDYKEETVPQDDVTVGCGLFVC